MLTGRTLDFVRIIGIGVNNCLMAEMKTYRKMLRGWQKVSVRLLLAQFVGVILSAACAFCSGCASSGYLKDRMRDGADVFTASVGKGFGVETRIGPAHAGFVGVGDRVGLRAGQFLPLRSSAGPSFIDSGAYGGEYCIGIFGYEYFGAMVGSEAGTRRKEYETIFCFIPTGESLRSGKPVLNPAYWTQIEVVAGVGISLRLGFNPGELIDFLLGWFMLDIYNDDLGRIRKTTPSNQASEATGELAPGAVPSAHQG